jgi:hypothetical protein
VEEHGRSFGDDDQSLTLLNKFKTYEKEVDMAKRQNRFRMEDIELDYETAIAGGTVEGSQSESRLQRTILRTR